MQVSPLIEFAHWDGPNDDPKGIVREMRDPYIKLKTTTLADTTPEGFVYVDRYPYATNTDYRYRLVYFSNDHRPIQYRETDWTPYNVGGQ